MCYTSQSWVSLWRKKPDRSRSDNLLPDYMATLQVQQRNVPPVITYMNIWIASKCTANGGWLNPTTALDLVGPDTKVQSRGSSLCCGSARLRKWLTGPAGLRRAEWQRCAYTGRVSLSSDTQQSWRTLTWSRHAAVWAWCIAATKTISRHGKRSKPS